MNSTKEKDFITSFILQHKHRVIHEQYNVHRSCKNPDITVCEHKVLIASYKIITLLKLYSYVHRPTFGLHSQDHQSHYLTHYYLLLLLLTFLNICEFGLERNQNAENERHNGIKRTAKSPIADHASLTFFAE